MVLKSFHWVAVAYAVLAPKGTLSMQEVLFTPLKTLYVRLKFIGISVFTVIDFKLVHELNAELPIEVTALGIIIPVRLLQYENAELSIFVTIPGIISEVRLLQF